MEPTPPNKNYDRDRKQTRHTARRHNRKQTHQGDKRERDERRRQRQRERREKSKERERMRQRQR
jgi:hypothetical protein